MSATDRLAEALRRIAGHGHGQGAHRPCGGWCSEIARAALAAYEAERGPAAQPGTTADGPDSRSVLVRRAPGQAVDWRALAARKGGK